MHGSEATQGQCDPYTFHKIVAMYIKKSNFRKEVGIAIKSKETSI